MAKVIFLSPFFSYIPFIGDFIMVSAIIFFLHHWDIISIPPALTPSFPPSSSPRSLHSLPELIAVGCLHQISSFCWSAFANSGCYSPATDAATLARHGHPESIVPLGAVRSRKCVP